MPALPGGADPRHQRVLGPDLAGVGAHQLVTARAAHEELPMEARQVAARGRGTGRLVPVRAHQCVALSAIGMKTVARKIRVTPIAITVRERAMCPTVPIRNPRPSRMKKKFGLTSKSPD